MFIDKAVKEMENSNCYFNFIIKSHPIIINFTILTYLLLLLYHFLLLPI